MRGAPAHLVTRPRDPQEFEDQAAAFLCLREAENNLILGLVAGLKAGRTFGPLPPLFTVVYDDGSVTGAAMRTPPHNLILASGTESRAIPRILDLVASETPDLPGLIGPKDIAREAVALWSRRTGVAAHLQMAERIYQLERVIRPRAVPGRMRPAESADVDLIGRWFHAFMLEAQPHLAGTPRQARENAERWTHGGGLRIWDDDGPVSMAGASGPTPNGIRIGAVYTPPQKRRRGYASALVAALSQAELDLGRRFCFLYTDLANPTSNKIYQDIGYEPVSDVDEYRFSAA